MKKKANKRIDWLDTLRGISMFLVIWGHCFINIKRVVRKWIYSFHMPIFFFISGITYKEEDLSTKEYFQKKFKGLIVPYIIFNIICFGIYYVLSLFNIIDDFNFIDWVIGLFYSHNEVFHIPCPSSWFLLTIFLSEMIFYFLKKYSKNDYELALGVCICGLIGYVNSLSIYQVYSPWHLESALTGVVFYFLGYMLSKNMSTIDNLMKKKFTAFCTGGTLGLIGAVCAYFNRRTSMHANVYGSISLFYIGALCTIIGLIIFVRLFMKHSFLFKNIGKRTLFYLAYHNIAIVVIRYFIEHVNDGNKNIFICAVCITLVFYPLSYLAYKYTPILCGKIKS